ncbi:MAG: hypothetical protein GX909_05695 [Clostridiaceae bacterium]|nr:hypothetical protein [Clostridiaceae bacterium]
MKFLEYEVYALSPLGRDSFQGYLRNDGRKIIIKKQADFTDIKVIEQLTYIEMQGIPHVLGITHYQEEEWLIFTWLEGKALNTQKRTPENIIQIIEKVLTLINKLFFLTDYHWFFLDLKMQHILIDENENILLIDFEHVYLSKKTSVKWQNIPSIGLNTAYCSPEIRENELSAKHHEYALALIALNIVQEQNTQALNKHKLHKALKQFPVDWQIKLKNALDGKGLVKRLENVDIDTKKDLDHDVSFKEKEIKVSKGQELFEDKDNIKSKDKLAKTEPFLFQHKIYLDNEKILNVQIDLTIESIVHD